MILNTVNPKRKPYQWKWWTAVLATGPLLLGVLVACSAEPPAAEPRPMAQESEPAVEGELLYRRYCASCHGVGGQGDGPVAELFSPSPPDLTQMATRNGGQYPVRELMRAIDGERTIRAHGDSDMPVWGAVFVQELQGSPHAQRTALLHVKAIAEYVRTLQDP